MNNCHFFGFDETQGELQRDTDRLIARFGLQSLVVGTPDTPVRHGFSKWTDRMGSAKDRFIAAATARLSNVAFLYCPLWRDARLNSAAAGTGTSGLQFRFEAITCALAFLAIEGQFWIATRLGRRARRGTLARPLF